MRQARLHNRGNVGFSGRSVRSFAKRFARDEQGAIAIIAAISFPVMVGFFGLGAEVSYWYMQQRKLQNMADVAAHAAAMRLRVGDNAGMDAAACAIAQASGFGACDAGLLIVNSPPESGPLAGRAKHVEVELYEALPRAFTAFFNGADPVRISARAVARVEDSGSAACALALSPNAPGAITAGGSTSVTLNGCELAANSTSTTAFSMGGASQVRVDCVRVAGEASYTSSLILNDPNCSQVQQRAPQVRDPYAAVPEPPGAAAARNATSTMYYAGAYRNLQLSGARSLEPGVYVISGVLSNTGNASISGTAVVFYLLPGASVNFNGNLTLNVSAPTTGPYAGILFFGSRANTETLTVNGGATSTFTGAVYAPTSDVQFSGNSASLGGGGCTQVIASTITFTGNSSVTANCEPAGGKPILVNQAVSVVE